MPLYVCAGTPRSGSTWLYNAMRLVLTERFPKVYGVWIENRDLGAEAEADATLIKLHANDDLIASEADVILTCHRDPRDIVVSMQSMGWIANDASALQHVRDCRLFHEFWSPRSAIDLSYAEITKDAENSLRRISEVLGVDLDMPKIQDIAERLRQTPNNRDESKGHDPEFLTHKNHRNDGRDGRWKGQLSSELERALVREHGDWIRKLGYPCD